MSPNPGLRKTPLYSMFRSSNLSICDQCGQNVRHRITHKYLPNLESKYLIMYVNHFEYIDKQARRIKSTISHFNVDNFIIPSHNQTQLCRFKVKSAMVRLGDTIDHGHYEIWTRS